MTVVGVCDCREVEHPPLESDINTSFCKPFSPDCSVSTPPFTGGTMIGRQLSVAAEEIYTAAVRAVKEETGVSLVELDIFLCY
ncbi:hypothetical protein JHK87_047515 [Glycine soja]|nr:hypothetical protein JHK87_047515 [Glycine soja]